jgi:hypothetical protein
MVLAARLRVAFRKRMITGQGGPADLPSREEESVVPRYLIRGNYTYEGLQGLLKEGGTERQKAIEALASSLGGHLVSLATPSASMMSTRSASFPTMRPPQP